MWAESAPGQVQAEATAEEAVHGRMSVHQMAFNCPAEKAQNSQLRDLGSAGGHREGATRKGVKVGTGTEGGRVC